MKNFIIVSMILFILGTFATLATIQYQKPVISQEEAVQIALGMMGDIEKYQIEKVELSAGFLQEVKGQLTWSVIIRNKNKIFNDTHWITINAYTGEIINALVSG